MEKNVEISYDEIEDIFYIKKQGKAKFSIDLALPSGDVVIDVGFDGLINGVEIFNASKFFSLIKDDVKKIKDIRMRLNYAPSYVSILVEIDSEKGIIKNSIIVPYNKKMALTE